MGVLAEKVYIGELLEAGEGEGLGHAAGGEDQFGVGIGFVGFGGDGFAVKVDFGDLIVDRLNGGRVEPFLRTPFQFGGVGDQSFGELRPVDGEIRFGRDDGDRVLTPLLSQRLDGSHCSAAAVIPHRDQRCHDGTPWTEQLTLLR